VLVLKRVTVATITLGSVAYLFKGRERGVPLWLVLAGAAVFSIVAVGLGFLAERRR
jgi:hypothetical protein